MRHFKQRELVLGRRVYIRVFGVPTKEFGRANLRVSVKLWRLHMLMMWFGE